MAEELSFTQRKKVVIDMDEPEMEIGIRCRKEKARGPKEYIDPPPPSARVRVEKDATWVELAELLEVPVEELKRFNDRSLDKSIAIVPAGTVIYQRDKRVVPTRRAKPRKVIWKAEGEVVVGDMELPFKFADLEDDDAKVARNFFRMLMRLGKKHAQGQGFASVD